MNAAVRYVLFVEHGCVEEREREGRGKIRGR